MRTRPDLVEVAVRHLSHGRDGSLGTVRVDARQEEQLRYIVTPRASAGHTLVVDEPAERGGTGAGPTPLEYFLTGALACLMNQYIKLALARHLAVENLRATARAHIHYAVDGALRDIIYDLYLEGTEAAEAITALARDAERYCYIHNTLKPALPMTVRVTYNGACVVDRTTGPTAG